MAEYDPSALGPEDGVTVPRLRMTDTGYVGLKISNGIIYEERRRELRWPNAVRTYQCMAEDATIASAISLVEMMIARVPWDVECDDEASELTKQRAEFIESCMQDMDHSWFQFIKEVSSMYTYGFSVHEKVFRRRLRVNGSRFNDGLVGLRRLPIRSQDTITEWLYSEDGRDLIGLKQEVDLDSRRTILSNIEVEIPRKKFLLFRTDVKKDNPEGKSPLASCYTAWKYRTALEETEAIGISRGLGGLPVIYLPPRYMSDDASDEEKKIYQYYQNIIRNIQNNEQAGLILPQMFDPDSRQPWFKFELVSPAGGATYNAREAIQAWDNKILQALFADLLKMGQDQVGSYSLADSKSSIMAMAIEHRLKEIQDVLNNDLIPSIYEMNGWDKSEMPKFIYGDLEERDLEEFSKFIQRCKAVGLIAPTRENVNYIAKVAGLPYEVPEDMEQEELNELLGPSETKAGEGMATSSGGLNGTAKSVSKDDNSAENSENAA